MSNPPKVLVPIAITSVMLTSSTVAEPAASETAWVSAGTYAVGDLRIRTTTHRVYQCQTAHTGVTTLPENDATRWKDIGATLRWAMFDNASSTRSTATASLTVVFRPGFFNAIALYNLLGSAITITVKDTPGGSVIYSHSAPLDGPYPDWYEWLFAPYRQISKILLSDILPYAGAELTIAITGGAAETVGIGMVCVGDLLPLISDSFGGTQQGARVEPVDYSYIKTDEFGDTTIVRRRAATDMRISIVLPRADAETALAIVQDVRATPAAWIGTDAAGFEPLNVFGLGSGSLVYQSRDICNFEINVKGMV